MAPPTSPSYGTDFYDGQRTDSRRSAETVVPLVLELVSPRSVLDVGCGVGTWLGVFKAHGVEDVLGLDGDYVDRSRLEVDPSEFRPADLTAPFDAGRRFDLVVSLEVGEHLPEARAEEFVRSLTAHADVVLFSAAVPHQGGTHHVNERWPTYWAELFARHGYACRDVLRGRLWMDPGVSYWYRQNMLMFVAEARADDVAWNGDAAPGFDGMPLIHPDLYLAGRSAGRTPPATLGASLRLARRALGDLATAARAMPRAALAAARRRL